MALTPPALEISLGWLWAATVVGGTLIMLYALAAGTAMGMLVPPAIFMIVIASVTNQSAVALFLAGFAAKLYYRNVSWRQVLLIAYESGILTAAVVFLLAVATIFQYLMGVPALLSALLGPLQSSQWLFLLALLLGLILIICIPELSLFLPHRAGLIR